MTHTKQKAAIRLAATLMLVLSILTTVSLAGCQLTPFVSGRDTAEGDGGTVKQTLAKEEPTVPTPPAVPVFLSPLTGLETTEALVSARPVAICLGNTSLSDTPQWGIAASQLLIEVPVEGGITRLMMVTNDYVHLDKIGSVRSTREALAGIANGLDAVSLFAGTCDDGPSATLSCEALDFLASNTPTVFYRDSEKNAPYNLMTSGSLVASGIESREYRSTLSDAFGLPFSFAPWGQEVKPAGDVAVSAVVSYSFTNAVSFSYSSDSGTYSRSQFGCVSSDADGSALAFDNLFILNSDTVTYENAQGKRQEVDLTHGGTGVWCSRGYREAITWQMEDGRLVFRDLGGEILSVNRGISYIGFARSAQSGSVEIH